MQKHRERVSSLFLPIINCLAPICCCMVCAAGAIYRSCWSLKVCFLCCTSVTTEKGKMEQHIMNTKQAWNRKASTITVKAPRHHHQSLSFSVRVCLWSIPAQVPDLQCVPVSTGAVTLPHACAARALQLRGPRCHAPPRLIRAGLLSARSKVPPTRRCTVCAPQYSLWNLMPGHETCWGAQFI